MLGILLGAGTTLRDVLPGCSTVGAGLESGAPPPVGFRTGVSERDESLPSGNEPVEEAAKMEGKNSPAFSHCSLFFFQQPIQNAEQDKYMHTLKQKIIFFYLARMH